MEIISIRQIQHYLYCPHRWGLIDIDCSWAENYFVVKADLLHERVHSDGHYSSRGKKVYTDLEVWNDKIGICGKTDCVEFDNGKVTVVEYKPTAPKDGGFNIDDAIQVYAQKLCIDEIFSCSSDAVIYYADSRKRVKLPFDTEADYYDGLLHDILQSIRSNLALGYIPPIKKGQKCSGCSMNDLCIPSVLKKNVKCGSLKKMIAAGLEEEQ